MRFVCLLCVSPFPACIHSILHQPKTCILRERLTSPSTKPNVVFKNGQRNAITEEFQQLPPYFLILCNYFNLSLWGLLRNILGDGVIFHLIYQNVIIKAKIYNNDDEACVLGDHSGHHLSLEEAVTRSIWLVSCRPFCPFNVKLTI